MGQTQFRSDDTVKWWLGFGDGSDGAYSSTGNATDAPIDSSCSGTSGTTSLYATNASFANGKPILIHQTRGTGVGNWELNQIQSYTAGTITLAKPLQNTYTDSGASQAQVIQLKQYSSFTQNSGHTLTAKAWNGDVGGIIAFLCKGTTTISGTINGAALGFAGGAFNNLNAATHTGNRGEGTGGASSVSTAANGNGGGAGSEPSNNGGAGGGHGTAGSNNPTGGSGGGAAVGNAGLTSLNLGGGGGGGASTGDKYGGAGGNGGAIVAIFASNLVISGSVTVNAGNGTGAANYAGGGGGAGGSILLKCKTATLGTNLLTAAAGSGGQGWEATKYGGAGGVGRIHLDYSGSYSGTTTPSIDVTNDITIVDLSAGGAFLYNFI